MALTPVEIRHIEFGKSLLGYKRSAVDKLLLDIAASFEDVWRERADLSDKVEQLEEDIVRYKELEALLRTTLVSAERASAEMRELARKEADLVTEEAHAEARAILRRAAVENERLRVESSRMRERLRLALASVDEQLDEDQDDAVHQEGPDSREEAGPRNAEAA
jgi:cell division initiation protein